MLFATVLGILFCVIVFFHYLQGLFSATLSAILAVFAAVLAFSYHETIVEKLLQGKAANFAHALMLVVLFAATYILLRVILDKAVPGNVRLAPTLDKVGGAVMGVVAATFAIGILAIGAQELPFDAAVMGYSKYDTTDYDVTVFGSARQMTAKNYSELHSDSVGAFEENDRKNTFPFITPGVDEIVVGTVSHLSDAGSLQGSQKLTAIHPDFLQETFAQRLGIQAGATRVTMQLPNAAEKTVEVRSVVQVKRVKVADAISPALRHSAKLKLPLVPTPENPEVFIPDRSQVLIAIRLAFSRDATDPDLNVRFSPGSARLVAKKVNPSSSSQDPQPCDYYPIGTLEASRQGGVPLLFKDKLDDFLFVNAAGPAGVDLVFAVDKVGFLENPSENDCKKWKINPGVFFEFKRMFRENLSAWTVDRWKPTTAGLAIGVVHQVEPPKPPASAPVVAPAPDPDDATPTPPAGTAPPVPAQPK